MFPKDKALLKEKEMYENQDRQLKTIKEQTKVQYRVKNEIFTVFEYYQPVRILGSGAYAVVCEALDTRTGKKVAIKKK